MTEDKIKPVLSRAHKIGNGTQDIYRFKNGYGASVVRFPGSYGSQAGLFELAVIRFEDGKDDLVFHLNYKTAITNDVIGWQTPKDIQSLLKRIARLRKPKDD